MSTVAKVVIGIDGSEASVFALSWAIGQAVNRGAELEVVHAWHLPVAAIPEGFTYPVSAADAELGAKSVLENAVTLALGNAPTRPETVRTVLAKGDAADALVRASSNASQVVVGTHGHGLLGRAILGSVAERVVLEATVPVTVIPRAPALPLGDGRIVVGVDGSPSSSAALRFAFDRAAERNAPVTIVNAVPMIGDAPAAEMGASARGLVDAMVHLAESTGHPVPESVEIRIVAGNAGHELVGCSRGASDLIVGYSGAAEHPWRFGSVSRRCVHQAPCAVTVVRI